MTQETLTIKTLSKCLKRLSNHNPAAGHTSATLADITPDYFKAFKSWGVETFYACCEWHLKHSSYFPAIKDFYTAYENVNNERHQGTYAALPEPELDEEITEAQAARNRKLCDIMLKVVAKEISAEEGIRQQEEELDKPLVN